jgi:hypothetical protein
MSQEDFRFWTLIAQSVTAFGTLAAVITSLYLARRDEMPRLVVAAGMVVEFGIYPSMQPGREREVEDQGETLRISVTNIGRRTVVVKNLVCRIGLFQRDHFSIMVPGQFSGKNPYSDTLPVRLEDGEDANFLMPKDDFQGGQVLEEAIPPRWVTRLPGWLRIGVETSSGETIWGSVDSSTKDLFRKFAE